MPAPFMDSLLTGLGTGIASKGIGLLNKKEKTLTGKQEGNKQKEYFEALYGDKLNPWEWAGAGGHGVGGTAAPNAAGLQARKTAREGFDKDMAMQGAQLENNLEVAKIGAGLTPKDKIPPGSKQGKGIALTEAQTIKTAKDAIVSGNTGRITGVTADLVKAGGKVAGEVQKILKDIGDATIGKFLSEGQKRKALRELEKLKGKYQKRKSDITLRKNSTSAPRMK